jgi:hypothetical protein
MMCDIAVTVQGVTPLLCHRYEGENGPDTPEGKPAHTGDRGTAREQAERSLYVTNDGKPMVPTPNIFRAIMDGGYFFKIGKKQVTTNTSSLIGACLTIDGVECIIKHKEPWTVDTRPVMIPATKGRVLRHRPRFDDWKLSFTLVLDTEIMSTKLLREIVDAAGKRVGLGDYRPARKGLFGRFVVVSWQESQAKSA